MKITRIIIAPEKLLSLEENERIFFIMASILANEIEIVHKLIVYSTKETKGDIYIKAQNTHSMFLVKILAGILYEGWNMLHKDYFKSRLSADYEPFLTDIGRDSMGKLKTYFNGDNIVNLIRNKYAFHYDSSDLKNDMFKLVKEDQLELFIAPDHGNCLYFMAHVISNNSLLRHIGAGDQWESLDKIFKEVLSVASNFLDFVGDIILVFFRKNKDLNSAIEEVEIPEPVSINDVFLPYFIKRS